ncbi:MAG: TetR/AcrR family transcriptional regulator [Marinomonas sp.]
MTAKNEPLGPDDWIKAGFRALTAGGPEAVKVEKIARSLNVSKGSFYWHFKNQGALKTAMMSHWEEWGTRAIINSNEGAGLTPRERLLDLGARITNSRDTPAGGLSYGGLMMETAIRDWSRFDRDIGVIVRKVNEARLRYIANLFTQLGCGTDQSAMKAKLLYSSMIGLEFLEHQNLAALEKDLGILLTSLLDHDGCQGE